MTKLRLLLNSPFTGANSFFALADSLGLFRQAGLEVEFTPGRGAYTAAQRLQGEGFDAAYGDLNALIELAALGEGEELPVAVFVAHPRSPCCITVARAGSIQRPADLAGRTLVGHRSDVALRTFAAYRRAAGLARDAVKVQTAETGMAELLLGMLAGQSDGVFGYMTTHTDALAGVGQAAPEVLRFLPYRDLCPALCGSALMVTPRFMRDHPAAVAGLVDALRGGIAAARQEPAASMAALLAHNPQADLTIEMERWLSTLSGEMSLGNGAFDGSGDLDDQRLEASIACLSEALGWAHRPAASQVFTRRFLARLQEPGLKISAR